MSERPGALWTTRPTDAHFRRKVGQTLSLACLVTKILYTDLVLKRQILRLPVTMWLGASTLTSLGLIYKTGRKLVPPHGIVMRNEGERTQ